MGASFALAIGYTTRSFEVADERLPDVVARDVREIAQASLLRAALRQVDQLLAESTEGHPWEPGAMRRALDGVDRELPAARMAYLKNFGASGVFDLVGRARQDVGRIRDLLSEGDLAQARSLAHSAVRPQFEAADSRLDTLLNASTEEIAQATLEQALARRRATRLALLLDFACVFVAVASASTAVRAVREEHARLRRQLGELEIFADRVAHDIRGPLTPAQLALDAVSRDTISVRLRRVVERGQRSLHVVEEIVEALHAFARSAGAPATGKSADASSILEDVVAENLGEAERNHIQLRLEHIDQTRLACSPGVLASIVSNLVRNAVRHMGPSTTRHVSLSARARGAHSEIVVQDTGPGLPPGFEARAFLPYARAEGISSPGLGLGLATVKRLAEGHGGSVRVESAPQGCRFTVSLPTGTLPEPPPEPLRSTGDMP